jgi:hypothetical protein
MPLLTYTGFRSAALLAVLLVFLPALSLSCSSTEKKQTKPTPPPPPPPPPPPAKADLLARAAEDVSSGEATPSFNRIYCFQEAIQGYLKIVRHYPKSGEAVFARKEITRLGVKVKVLRTWKQDLKAIGESLDDPRLPQSRQREIARRLAVMKKDLPAPFLKQYVEKVAAKARRVMRGVLQKAVARIEPAAEKAERHGRLAEARALWNDLPKDLFAIVEDMAALRRQNIARLETKAMQEADKARDRAQDAMARGHLRIASATLHRAWERLKSFHASDSLRKEGFALLRRLARKEIPFSSGSLGDLDRRLLGLIEKTGQIDLRGQGAKERVAQHEAELASLKSQYNDLVKGGVLGRGDARKRLDIIQRVLARTGEFLD